ncbi:radical SAM family heme chaperone HemW [Dyadobacter tibetensis]|uniref:radical SAM family heme chaperone HemW n=1 Tax=Dyadobacter tibetensis TaxID=1211851 RepID=UPI00047278E9|nr:radical SAM family heme chaperone HemW [Dyadobacter tibetensis]
MHIYIHIPFCKQACFYCDFHFSTNTSAKGRMVEAIKAEMVIQKHYLGNSPIDTIYLGGGTPSMLSQIELESILEALQQLFTIRPNAEITLEANPDDLTAEKIKEIAAAGINRLSIGIQSFYDPHLKALNRAHQSAEALNCVLGAQDAGITNISVDLIYSIPHPDHKVLYEDIHKVLTLNIPHISAYCLTIEPKTTFGNWLKNKKMPPIDETFAAEQFEILIRELTKGGFEQYEISNFAANKQYSEHNTAYWKAEPYLGLGPSAHSFNGAKRSFNISNNARYMAAVEQNILPNETELLTSADKTNEYLLTGLRTKWGVTAPKLQDLSEGTFLQQRHQQLENLIEQGFLELKNDHWVLTPQGKFFADRIASDLFID